MKKHAESTAKKVVVVDGLARSGTTLLSSLIHSQERAACYRGVFHEFLGCDIGRWKEDYACHPPLRPKDKVELVSDFSPNYQAKLKKAHRTRLTHFFSRNLELSLSRLNALTMAAIKRRSQTDRIGLNRWEELCDFSSIRDFDGLDEQYQKIANELDVDVLGFRWNQGFPYIQKFLRSPNHYWISVVRHPIARARSDFKTFSESYESALEYTMNFSKSLSHHKNKNHIILHFEDMITDPEAEIRRIFEALDLELPSVNLDLVQQSGSAYRVESSDVVAKAGSHKVGRPFRGFERSKLEVPKSDIPEDIAKKFENLRSHSIFARYFD